MNSTLAGVAGIRKLPLEIEIREPPNSATAIPSYEDMVPAEAKTEADLAAAADREAMESFRAGDPEAFTVLYHAHQPAIFRFALHMTGDPAKAADVVQDVFVWLVDHAAAFDPERGLIEAFLLGVARNMVRRRERSERRWLPFDLRGMRRLETNDSAESAARAIDGAALRKAIARLPARYREAVVLCDLESMSYEEAATACGCAVGTIRSRLHRGRELLARKFQPKKEVRR